MEKFIKLESFGQFLKLIEENLTLEVYHDRDINDSMKLCISDDYELTTIINLYKKIQSKNYYYKKNIKPLTFSQFACCVVYQTESLYYKSKKDNVTAIDIVKTDQRIYELKTYFEHYLIYRESDCDGAINE